MLSLELTGIVRKINFFAKIRLCIRLIFYDVLKIIPGVPGTGFPGGIPWGVINGAGGWIKSVIAPIPPKVPAAAGAFFWTTARRLSVVDDGWIVAEVVEVVEVVEIVEVVEVVEIVEVVEVVEVVVVVEVVEVVVLSQNWFL